MMVCFSTSVLQSNSAKWSTLYILNLSWGCSRLEGKCVHFDCRLELSRHHEYSYSQLPMTSVNHSCRCTIAHPVVTFDLDKSNEIKSCFILALSSVVIWLLTCEYASYCPVISLTISKLSMPYLCVPHRLLVHRWKKTDNIAVSRFALYSSLFLHLPSLVQMDIGSHCWPGTLVTLCSPTHWSEGEWLPVIAWGNHTCVI